MAQRFLVVLLQVVSLFLIMAVGFALGKADLITKKGTKDMSSLIMYGATPCLMISSLQVEWDSESLKAMGLTVLAILATFVVFIVLSQFLYKKEPEDEKLCMRLGSIYGNCGYMGIPLVTAVLGKDVILVPVLMIAIFNLLTYTHGIVLMGGRKAFSAKTLLANPPLIAIVLGVALMLLRVQLPAPIFKAMESVGSLNSPLAMVVIGAQLAKTELSGIFSQPRIYKVILIRNIIFPVLAAFMLMPFGLDKLTYVALVILIGTPCAAITSIFAERFDRSPSFAAQLVSLSTLISAVTLPLAAVMAEALVR